MKKLLLSLIRFYRKHISPHFPPMCRYYPTCSCYAIEAIETHGTLRGTLLALWRVLRCNPLSAGGYDPVPPKREK
ncbi:MAG: membrane protein insertion efficiency factor YidD [Clostridia bacterium]|nr:membrane protein insertion efficiency factor YidD [Clostridia bacterium]